MTTPAQQLVGFTLSGGWKVLGIAPRKPNATGGFFSTGYIVENDDGRRGFLKAMDYQKALEQPNAAEVLNSMTQAYLFERDLCLKVNHLSKIARALDSGSITPHNDPFRKVEYLIFELADGDIRAHLDTQDKLDTVFVLRTLHNIAVGLEQLHRADIIHQDLKPSNVLVYGAEASSKLCDLGRAWAKNLPSPNDRLLYAGDRTYAPVEVMYGHLILDEQRRRLAWDIYHLGSLIVFLFTRVHLTAFVVDRLDEAYRPIKWGGTFEDVLPYVREAFATVLDKCLVTLPGYLRVHLRQYVSDLCNPDPERRGHPRNASANQFCLARYISGFDWLAHKAQVELFDNANAA